jgi:hypothetical protein
METWSSDIVEIIPPDRTLLAKIGLHNLNTVFNPGAETAAQAIINASRDDLSSEMLQGIADLQTELDALAADRPILTPIVEISFLLKTNAGLAGYDLLSAIGKSLYLYCEVRDGRVLSPKEREVIIWHVRSVVQIAAMDLKGDSGEIGAAIHAELCRLASKLP